MINYIGIDPSKSSTAISVESNKGEFLFNYTTKNLKYKWINKTKDYIKFTQLIYYISDIYSENEYYKLQTFSQTSNLILKDILHAIDLNEDTKIGIEGYSYGFKSSPGPIIDLVGLGQSIRLKLFENIPNIKDFRVISPKRLKTLTCEMVFGTPKILLNKKTGEPLKTQPPATNNEGISGGEFNKKDMFNAVLEGNINSPIYGFCIENKTEILLTKEISKPFDDIIDALLVKEMIKSNKL